jgi:ribosomal protein S18 acetylase RimI-like enzyme
MPRTVRRLNADDRSAWTRFLADVPPGEERFLKEDVADPATFERWIREPGRLVAVIDDEIAGAVAALSGTGWSSHVAELRLIVAGSHRGRGLGRELARHGLITALNLGCTHVYVEVVAEQTALVAMFRDLGFKPEALLADFVRDRAGEPHDLMLLTHNAANNWSSLAGIGLAEADA